MLALDFDRSLDQQPFEEQFMARCAAIFGDAIRHKLFFQDSAEESSGKGMRNKPYSVVIHNI